MRLYTRLFYLDIFEHELDQELIDELLEPKMLQIVQDHQQNIDQQQLLNNQ
jgi:hypothetical protein